MNETVGAAGTSDMRLQIDGVWYVADLKTAPPSSGRRGSFAIQLAIYQGHTSIYDRATNTHDLPLVLDDDRGIIVHFPANDPPRCRSTGSTSQQAVRRWSGRWCAWSGASGPVGVVR